MVERKELLWLGLPHCLLSEHLLGHRGVLPLLLDLRFEHGLTQLLLTKGRLQFALCRVLHYGATERLGLVALAVLSLLISLVSSLVSCGFFLLPRCPPGAVCIERMALVAALCLPCEFLLRLGDPERHHVVFGHLAERDRLGLCVWPDWLRLGL